MYAWQRGRCYICGEPEKRRKDKTGVIRRLSIDHDHETGKVRGLLCANCNNMLGLALDNPVLLEKGAAYIRQFK
jgi:hypothetical protein